MPGQGFIDGKPWFKAGLPVFGSGQGCQAATFNCGTFDQSRPSGAVVSAGISGLTNTCIDASCGSLNALDRNNSNAIVGSSSFSASAGVNPLQFRMQLFGPQICYYESNPDFLLSWRINWSLVCNCTTQLGGQFITIGYTVGLGDLLCVQSAWSVTWTLTYSATLGLHTGQPYVLGNASLSSSPQLSPYEPSAWTPTATVVFSQ